MKRSMAIASAVVCALTTSSVVSAQSIGFDRFGFEIRLGGGVGGGSYHAARELERAEARLHGARRAHQEAVWRFDAAMARQQGLLRELGDVERRIAEQRATEHELRRLHNELDAAGRDAARIEANLARLRSLAGDAQRAADAARNAHFERAAGSSLIIEARTRLESAQQELDRARQWVLEQQLYPSVEWQRTIGWRDDLTRGLADAENNPVPTHEIDRLRGDLAAAERRLEALAAEAISREPTVRAAESRFGDAQRRLDEAWARVERDLEHDPEFQGARDDAARLSADAARADHVLYSVRDQVARLNRDIDRVRQIQYAVDVHELERRAGIIRRDADCLARDVQGARQCLSQAERELRDAQFAYDAAYSVHQRCVAEQRNSVSFRIEHHDGPKHDSHERHGDDQRGGRHGGDRRDNDDGGRLSDPDDRVARSSSGGGGSSGTYRDRGERYERAREEESSSRQRTRG